MGDTLQRRGFAPEITIQILFPHRIDQVQSVFGRPDDMVEESLIGHRVFLSKREQGHQCRLLNTARASRHGDNNKRHVLSAEALTGWISEGG
jgi:hypothetical protein